MHGQRQFSQNESVQKQSLQLKHSKQETLLISERINAHLYLIKTFKTTSCSIT